MKPAAQSQQKAGAQSDPSDPSERVEQDRAALYSYRITWSEEGQIYLGLCAEFSGVSWFDQSQEAALKGIRKTVDSVLKRMQQAGETPPEPFSKRTYSGKFMVRMTQQQHRALALEAAEEGVSINQWAVSKLALRANDFGQWSIESPF